MTVYVVNRNHDDISDAERFGTLRHVNIGYVYPDQVDDRGNMPDAINSNLDDCALDFHPERDYLLIVGDHLQLVAFAAKLGAVGHSYFRVLRYDRQEKGYYPVHIELGRVQPQRLTGRISSTHR